MQITTVDNPIAVNRIIRAIRNYNLHIPYQIWVITESDTVYEGADLVRKVPKQFVSISHYKARALDYSTRLREVMNLTASNIKILYLDDDTIPSQAYIKDCFEGDYDIMEGIIQPKVIYGSRYSYVENMRTLSCMSVCSVFQGHSHPVWVHGEGLCVRASVEQKVQWQFNVIASEDLCFGHKAATMGLSWGFTWTPIYITSPLTFKDFFKQRKRWIWGNIHAIKNILTKKAAARIIGFYCLGSTFLVLSLLFVVQDIMEGVHLNWEHRIWVYSTLGIWQALYGFIGYSIGGHRLKHVLASMVLAWYTSLMNTLPIWASLVSEKPTKFEVIRKI
jgi:hypothetical protein